MMIVKAYQIDESLKLTKVSAENISFVARQDDTVLWIDFNKGTNEEIEKWLVKLNISDLERRLCLEARDRPGFYPLNKVIYFVIPVLIETTSQKKVEYISFLWTETFLLSIHREQVMQPEDLADLDVSDSWLAERSIAGLLSALLIDQTLRCLHHTSKLRNAISTLEHRMEHNPESVEAKEILELRSELIMLTSVVRDQRPSLLSLSRLDRSSFQLGSSMEHMNCAMTNCQTADDSLTWLGHRVGDLRSAFEMHAQNKANRRLNMITILSAIFMPITLLAGIWGMNFESMPELTLPYAYPIALGSMVAVGIGMFLFFRRNGWLN